MSLINDALRRASQSDKARPRPAVTSAGLEPALPAPRPSRLSLLLAVAVAVSLALAIWFFWQWWNSRRDTGLTSAAAPLAAAHAVAPPVAVTPAAPAQPVAALAQTAAAPSNAAAAGLPNVANYNPSPWPVNLKLGGIFFSKTNPQALINGSIYVTGEDIQGVVVKEIDKDKVTVEWDGHSRVLKMGAP